MGLTATIDELAELTGYDLGCGDWLLVTQQHVNTFADNTGDRQWIHVDVERAKTESPFGGPIAHGYLTLSLLIPMWKQLLAVSDAAVSVNYGLNRVRFPAPLPVGGQIRLTAALEAVTRIAGGIQVIGAAVIELEGSDKPACVAKPVFRFYRQTPAPKAVGMAGRSTAQSLNPTLADLPALAPGWGQYHR